MFFYISVFQVIVKDFPFTKTIEIQELQFLIFISCENKQIILSEII